MAGVTYRDGAYNAEIRDIAFAETDDGTPQVLIRGKILQELDSETGEYVPVSYQYERTVYLRYAEEYKDILLAKLRAAGWTGSRFENLKDDLCGKTCTFICKVRIAERGKYAGKEVEGWDLHLPPKQSAPLENKASVAKKLNAYFGSSLKESSTAVRERVQEPQPVAAGDPPDDEIPF